MAFDYTIKTTPAQTLVTMSGRLVDKQEAIAIGEEMNQSFETGHKNFIVDLSGLEYMNSTGLNIIINLMNKSRQLGGKSAICAPSVRIKSLFTVTKLDTVYKICTSCEEAENYLNEQ